MQMFGFMLCMQLALSADYSTVHTQLRSTTPAGIRYLWRKGQQPICASVSWRCHSNGIW